MHALRVWTALGISLLLSVACSSGDDVGAHRNESSSGEAGNGEGGSGGVTCTAFVDRLLDCGVITGSRLADCVDDNPLLPCVLECATNATCDEMKAMYCQGAYNGYADCLHVCHTDLPQPMLVCDDGSSIPVEWRCDGVADCAGGEDEACPTGSFVCNDGRSIPAGWQCDQVADCTTGEDERDCGEPYVCKDGTTLPSSKECDLTADCAEGEDELGCAELACR